ncbi:MAG: hypothetical protein NC095_09750 [Muribaculum sp.]|nr:hypothetical protein [Muribaculum sp.]
MGRLRLIAIVSAMLFLFQNMLAYDMVQINTDEKTIKAVTANTVAIEIASASQDSIVSSINEKQQKMAKLLGELMAYKELTLATLKNVKGFKKESQYYKHMVSVGADIMRHSAEAYTLLSGANFIGKATGLINVSNLVVDAVGLGKVFADIVTNSSVKNPLDEAGKSEGDGHNLLNRHERLMLADNILVKLRKIDRDLQRIAWYAKTASLNDLIRHLDHKTYLTMWNMKWDANVIMKKWDKLTK